MKKLMKVMLLAMTLVTLLTVMPLSANASTSNKQKVFTYITEEMGLNSAAACGIMANIERESNFNSSTIIRDSNGKRSGGLCMWNGGRLSSLQRYCSSKGLNYLSVEGQLSYLEHELNQKYYKHILNYLKKVKNTSQGAYDAAYYWCYYFEIPASRATKARQRGNSAISNYWPTFGNKQLETPTTKVNTSLSDLGSYVTISWTDGGKNATDYKLYVAKKLKNGKYDWENSKIYWTESLKKKIDTDTLGEGSFAAFVKAVHDNSGSTSKNSNTVKFSIACKTHSYTSKVTKDPTLTKEGTKLLTCKQCGYKMTKSIAKINYKTIGNYTMEAPTAAGRAETNVTLKWNSYKGADGYRLYIKDGDDWKKIADIDSKDETKFLCKGLKSATEYSFKIRFFVEKNGKRYYSKYSKAYVTSTKTAAPTLENVVGRRGGTATLTWNKVKGADRYAIYVSESKNGEYKLVCNLNDKNATSYTVKDLKPGAYYFRIRAGINCDEHRVYSVDSNIKGAVVL